MDRNPYAAPAAELDTPTQDPVSMARYGLLCFITLLTLLAGHVGASRLAERPMWQGVGILELILSVQFASWRFVRAHRRVMSRSELNRFALSCGVAFWVFDEGVSLIGLIRAPGDQPIRAGVTWLLGTGFDWAVAAAIVFVIVPPLARHLVSHRSVSTPRS
jgi:hypothetical protein